MKRSIFKKLLLPAVLAALVGCGIGASLAWLSVRTDPVVNTFTYGNIDITLEETTTEYKILPGTQIAKDPVVTVLGGSEDCWLFVTVDKTNWPSKVSFEIADGWTELSDGVYWREVAAADADQAFPVLKENQVTVSSDMTKAEVEAASASGPTTLTFTAYAVQKDGVASASDAWAIAKPTP